MKEFEKNSPARYRHENLPFTKMSGTGNDFIVFDNRSKRLTGTEQAFFKSVCRRHFSVGADGVILVEESRSAPVRMRYYNSDGLEAAMCGNGARCTAFFAFQKGLVRQPSFVMEASDGLHVVRIKENIVTVQMTKASGYKTGLDIVHDIGFDEGGFVDTGVPHFVIFVPDVNRVHIRETAPDYRHHRIFPEGTNVNYVQTIDAGRIRVRTFERGVEDETLSCGTGCVASALIASKERGCVSPVAVETRGGELVVDFDAVWKEIHLSGPVEIVFEGVLV